MSYELIREEIANRLQSVSGIYNVYQRHRWNRQHSKTKSYQDIFKDSDNKLHAWIISKEGHEDIQNEDDEKVVRTHKIMIYGFYGFNEENESEHEFNTLVENVAFDLRNGDRTLNNTCYACMLLGADMKDVEGIGNKPEPCHLIVINFEVDEVV